MSQIKLIQSTIVKFLKFVISLAAVVIAPRAQFPSCATAQYQNTKSCSKQQKTPYAKVTILQTPRNPWNILKFLICFKHNFSFLYRASCFHRRFFLLPTDAQENCFQRSTKICITITAAATCFGVITIITYFIHLPMKMEPIVSSETSAIRTQTPRNYPKRNKLHLEHGESLKTRITYFISKILIIAVLDAMSFIAELITYAATPPD